MNVRAKIVVKRKMAGAIIGVKGISITYLMGTALMIAHLGCL